MFVVLLVSVIEVVEFTVVSVSTEVVVLVSLLQAMSEAEMAASAKVFFITD